MARKRVPSSVWSDFTLAYARALHEVGASSVTVEDDVAAVLDARGVEGHVMATPTALWVEVDGVAHVRRLEPGRTDLARWVDITRLGADVAEGAAPAAATQRLATYTRPRAGRMAWLGYAGISAGAAMVGGGSLNDVVASFGLGAAAATTVALLGPRPGWSRVAEGVAALVVSAGALALAPLGVSGLAAFAAVLVLAPGLQLTTAAAEVASGHWTAGTARFGGASASLFVLALGLFAPTLVLPFQEARVPVVAAPAGMPWVVALLLPALAARAARARNVDLLPILGIGAAALLAASAVDGPAGPMVGALVATVLSDRLAPLARVPPAVWATPALLPLVPGSVGLRGMGNVLAQDVGQGMQTWVAAGVAAGSLAVGILVGHALTGPRPRPSRAPRRSEPPRVPTFTP